MKLTYVLAVVCMCTMVACSKGLAEVEEEMSPSAQDSREIIFSTGMTVGKVEPWKDGFESRSKSRVPLESCATVIHYYDRMNGEVVNETKQSTSGVFRERLLFGDHELRFLAHNDDSEAPDPSGSFFSPKKVTDTFLCNKALTVGSSTSMNQVIKMERVVGKVSVVIRDAIPEGVRGLRMTLGSHCGKLDMSQGKGAADELKEFKIEWNMPESLVGKTNQTATVFTFVPTDELLTTVKIEALDEGGRTLFERTAAEVPVQVNRCTTANCNLFSKDETFSFEIAEDWIPGVTIEM